MRQQEKYDWMVYVSCMTFNHAPYIVDAMNGFTMQETNFPFVCTIVDDASTDGEQEIIKQYLNEHFDLEDKNVVRQEETDDYVLTFARHKTNLNCYFAVFFLRYNHYSIKKSKVPYTSQWRDKAKYIAICEGDDFWVDKRKLQIQYDFLRKHSDYTMVFTAINLLFSDGRQEQEHRYRHDNDSCDVRDCILLGGGYLKLASMMFVRGKEEYFSWIRNSPVGDCPMALSLFSRGKVMYMDRVTATYRVNAVGSWTQSNYSSFRKKFKHNKVASQMWKSFDRFSDYKYHKIIKRKLLTNYFNLFPTPIKLIGYSFIKCFYSL